jgi:hypothetical protein
MIYTDKSYMINHKELAIIEFIKNNKEVFSKRNFYARL